MEKIGRLLQRYSLTPVKAPKKLNPTWERAEEFGAYMKLPTRYVLKLFKQYGEERVLSMRSWLKDAPNVRNPKALLLWKLKQSDKQIDI